MNKARTQSAAVWGAILAILALSALVALFLQAWFPTLNLEKFGLFLSLGGLGLSVVGFPVALFQLFRTQKAALAAKIAVDEAKASWVRYDVRNEISKSLTYARVTLEHITNEKWHSAANGMVEFNLSLSRLTALANGLSENDVESIRNERAELVYLVDALESAEDGIPSIRVLKRSRSRLRNQLTLLTEIEIRFQGNV